MFSHEGLELISAARLLPKTPEGRTEVHRGPNADTGGSRVRARRNWMGRSKGPGVSSRLRTVYRRAGRCHDHPMYARLHAGVGAAWGQSKERAPAVLRVRMHGRPVRLWPRRRMGGPLAPACGSGRSSRSPHCSGKRLVGATGFEPATSCSQSRRATRLRYAPTRDLYDSSALVYAELSQNSGASDSANSFDILHTGRVRDRELPVRAA